MFQKLEVTLIEEDRNRTRGRQPSPHRNPPHCHPPTVTALHQMAGAGLPTEHALKLLVTERWVVSPERGVDEHASPPGSLH